MSGFYANVVLTDSNSSVYWEAPFKSLLSPKSMLLITFTSNNGTFVGVRVFLKSYALAENLRTYDESWGIHFP